MSEIDDLFDYDAGLDDVLKNLPSAQDKETSQTENNNNDADATKVLGLDADIKPTKQRAPIAKLDEARLLSQKGIPKLRKEVRTKLKFKGKGHEFSDLGRLLNFYQLWLDDLYPRAKFADGLAMIEKLGHSKRVQIMRREWINEEKPDYRRRDDDNNDDYGNRDNDHSTAERNRPADASTTNNDTTNDTPLDDELGNLFAELPRRSFAPEQDAFSRQNDDAPPDDDLDMLLAEAENVTSAPKNSYSPIKSPGGDAPPDDDLDMLLAEAENTSSATRQAAHTETAANPSVTETYKDNDVAPLDDDLDMLLAEAEDIAQAGNGGRKSIFN